MKHYIATVVFFISIVCGIESKKSDDESIFSSTSSSMLPIEHSFGAGQPFTSRGQIQLKLSKVATASFDVDYLELSPNFINEMKELVKKDGLYMIRAPTKLRDVMNDGTGNSTQYVSSFVRACYLYGSGLKETIKISIDNSGNVIALSIESPKHSCSYAQTIDLRVNIFNSTVIIHQQTVGAIPDTQTYIKKLEQEKSEKAAGKSKDNRSFLAKYWMYILPVFLILMLSAQAEPEGEEAS